MTLTGTVTHAGVFDTENVAIDWGDGTTDGAVWAPFNIICVSCPTSFAKISDTKVSYQSSHEYAAPGTYTVKVKVNDLLGDVDEETLSVKVIGTQVLTFPSVAGHTYGDAPFEVAASGGLSTERSTSAAPRRPSAAREPRPTAAATGPPRSPPRSRSSRQGSASWSPPREARTATTPRTR